MSCEDCEKAQVELGPAFYRWGTANIELNGCDKHLGQIFNALSLFQDYVGVSQLGPPGRTVYRLNEIEEEDTG